jgi:hypothetical protein
MGDLFFSRTYFLFVQMAGRNICKRQDCKPSFEYNQYIEERSIT